MNEKLKDAIMSMQLLSKTLKRENNIELNSMKEEIKRLACKLDYDLFELYKCIRSMYINTLSESCDINKMVYDILIHIDKTKEKEKEMRNYFGIRSKNGLKYYNY